MNTIFNTIIVSGKSNVGKSTAIKAFIKMVIALDNVVLAEPIPEKYDYWFKFILNNKIIGVITFGDSSESISRAFRHIGMCDYYICASHLFGDTVRTITNLKDEYKIINPLFLNKTGIITNKSIVNEESVQKDNELFSNQLFQIFKYMVFR